MNYLTLEGDHYQLGLKRGTIYRKSGIRFPLNLDKFQLAHGKHSEEILREFFPEVCEEIKGVSHSMGIQYLPLVSWMLCMGCCMYNLEGNTPTETEVRGCTAFAFSKNNQVIYGRNNDLPPYLRRDSKSELYVPKNGTCFHMATSSFINGEEGLNEHGLAVAMTFVMTRLSNIKPGFNSCFIVRFLLEKAATTQQAVSMLMPLPIASNCNILLADKTGKLAVVECTPTVKRVREAETTADGTTSFLCTVNHFTSPEMTPYDDSRGDDYDSLKRYKTVMDYFSQDMLSKQEACISLSTEGKTGDLTEQTKCLLKGQYGFLCQYDNVPNFETVWSSVFNLKTLAVCHTEGDPRSYPFLEDHRLCFRSIHIKNQST